MIKSYGEVALGQCAQKFLAYGAAGANDCYFHKYDNGTPTYLIPSLSPSKPPMVLCHPSPAREGKNTSKGRKRGCGLRLGLKLRLLNIFRAQNYTFSANYS